MKPFSFPAVPKVDLPAIIRASLEAARPNLKTTLLADLLTPHLRPFDDGLRLPAGEVISGGLRIPLSLGYMLDYAFVMLPEHARAVWLLRLAEAISLGRDFSQTTREILIRVLAEVVLPAVSIDQWGIREAVTLAVTTMKDGGDSEKASSVADTAAHRAYADADDHVADYTEASMAGYAADAAAWALSSTPLNYAAAHAIDAAARLVPNGSAQEHLTYLIIHAIERAAFSRKMV